MKIIKIVNNNIVTSLDEQNREIIVMGRGLGFGRKPGMTIEDEKVEKVFRLNSAGENQKLVDIIQDIPLEHIKAAAEKEHDWQLVSPNYEGVRIACTDEKEQGWFLLRQSLHDPVLPLNIESNVEGSVNRITDRVLALLSNFKALKQ